MRKNKTVLAGAVIGACCVVAAWLSTSIHGGQNTYELRPQISVQEHRTDIVRVIDAYERLMDRYLNLTERQSAMVAADIENIAVRLDSIDGALAQLLARTARMEKAWDHAALNAFHTIVVFIPAFETASR